MDLYLNSIRILKKRGLYLYFLSRLLNKRGIFFWDLKSLNLQFVHELYEETNWLLMETHSHSNKRGWTKAKLKSISITYKTCIRYECISRIDKMHILSCKYNDHNLSCIVLETMMQASSFHISQWIKIRENIKLWV